MTKLVNFHVDEIYAKQMTKSIDMKDYNLTFPTEVPINWLAGDHENVSI